MKHKKTITSIVFILVGLGGLHAQETVISSGGEATGSGGTTSYTLGQTAYTTDIGTDRSVAQGVQQPFEISTTVGVDEVTINLELSVYPNPTTDYLTLKVEKIEGLSIALYDLNGKSIENKTIKNSSTTINLEAQPSATYYLKVTKDGQLVKTYRIIKY